MTADLTWPYFELQPQNVAAGNAVYSGSGGRSLTGMEQVVVNDAGYWEITLDSIPIRTNSDVLLWRKIESGLRGRSKTILIPAYSRKFAPTGGLLTISAQITTDIPQNSSVAHIEITSGGIPEAGMDFSVGERLYRIVRISGTSPGDIYVCKIWPPAREAMTAGNLVEFDHPVCRCRLKNERGMDVSLSLLQFGTPSVTFCEDV